MDQELLKFADLGFSLSFRAEIDPPFPGDGNWRAREIRVDPSGDLLVKVSATNGEPWVGFFGTERRGLLVGVYACPNPEHLLVCTGMDAYLIDVTEPDRMIDLGVLPTTGVTRPTGTDLVAVASFTSVAAIDKEGLRWSSARIFLDDCEFEEQADGSVGVRGSVSYPGDERTLRLDAASGAVLDGTWALNQVPGQDSVVWHRDRP